MKKVSLIAVVLLIIVAGVGCTSTPTQPTVTTQTLIDQTQTIPENFYWEGNFSADSEEVLNVNLNVANGGNVDVFLMNNTGFNEYKNLVNDTTGAADTFHFYTAGSSLNVLSKSYQFTVPSSGTYYVVIDNKKDNITGEAVPTGDVTVSIKITGSVTN